MFRFMFLCGQGDQTKDAGLRSPTCEQEVSPKGTVSSFVPQTSPWGRWEEESDHYQLIPVHYVNICLWGFSITF